MKHTTRVNYDEVNIISKKFHDEVENYSKLLSSIQQKMVASRSEWVGEAANEFFKEMENGLLPAVLQLSQSLKVLQEVLNKIVLTIYAADQETAPFFRGGGTEAQDFGDSNLVGLNHEMARELLWSEYPTDQRGTYFRQFWDTRESNSDPNLKVGAISLQSILDHYDDTSRMIIMSFLHKLEFWWKMD